MEQSKSKYRVNVDSLAFVKINHGSSFKKVFRSNEDTKTALTQFAYSKFEKGQFCEEHSHPTMDEYFYVLSGGGTYFIGDEVIEMHKGDAIRIPAGIKHKVVNDSQGELTMIYFGIALIQ